MKIYQEFVGGWVLVTKLDFPIWLCQTDGKLKFFGWVKFWLTVSWSLLINLKISNKKVVISFLSHTKQRSLCCVRIIISNCSAAMLFCGDNFTKSVFGWQKVLIACKWHEYPDLLFMSTASPRLRLRMSEKPLTPGCRTLMAWVWAWSPLSSSSQSP